MRLYACLAALALTACDVPDDTRGSVYQFNGDTVTIRGQFQPGEIAKPTSAMVAQANEVCPGAQYLSANPTPSDTYTFLYLFKCP